MNKQRKYDARNNALMDWLMAKFGYVHKSKINEQLDWGFSVAKRLDEHRELVEAVHTHTQLYQERPWHIAHAETQDDYLMRLYHFVHGTWPENVRDLQITGAHIRPRPAVLAPCTIPEYLSRPLSESRATG